MRAYLITSTEYKYNSPDRFIMDVNGNYYGVMPHSYAIIREFPQSIEYWMNATCSDSDRFFNIHVVDLSAEQLAEFDGMTKEYIKMEENAPVFGEQYPDSMSKEWKSKKAYNEAVEGWMKRHNAWVEESKSDIAQFNIRMRELVQARIQLFKSFINEEAK